MRRQWVSVAAALSLMLVAGLVTGCGSRLPDAALARIDAAGAGGGGGTGSGNNTAAGPNGNVTTDSTVVGVNLGDPTAPGATVPGGGPSPQNPGGGTVPGGGPSPQNPGGGPGTTAAPATNCAGTPSGPGVTDKEIKVATMVTDSGPLPGATAGQYRGTAAYMAMINAQGGVCGRKITVVEGDDGLDPQRARAEFTRLQPSVFAFVGNLAVADSGYVDLIKSTGVPYIGTTVDPAGRSAPNALPHAPSDHQVSTSAQAYLQKTYPSATKLGYLYTDVGGVKANVPGSVASFKKAGYQFAYGPSGASATSPDYTPEVLNLQRAKVDLMVLFAFEINMEVRMARNMKQQNYEPPVKIATIGYNSQLIPLLGPLSNGWSNYITYRPVLNDQDIATDPALKTFVEWNKKVFPSAQVDLFPVGGWGAAALFVQALRNVGGNLSRASIIDAINKIPSYDGGGLIGTQNPNAISNCFIMVKVVNQKWVREYPSSGFECSMGQVVEY